MKKLLLTLLMIPTLSFGEEQVVYGTIDCGEWLDKRANRTVQTDYYEGIVMGHINGYNDARSVNNFKNKNVSGTYKQRDVWSYPSKITPSQVYYYLDKECAANPLEVVNTILYDFIRKERG